jgi:hypothetical protein
MDTASQFCAIEALGRQIAMPSPGTEKGCSDDAPSLLPQPGLIRVAEVERAA